MKILRAYVERLNSSEKDVEKLKGKKAFWKKIESSNYCE